MMNLKKMIVAVLALSFVTSAAFAADAATEKRPRVKEVNKREKNQKKRIANGDLKPGQKAEDRKDVKDINAEKKAMEKQDGGHLTKADQKDLNQQLNQNSRRIDNQEARNKAAQAGAPAAAPAAPAAPAGQ